MVRSLTGFSVLTSSFEPTSVVAGDFNGDGKQDLAVLSAAGTGLSEHLPRQRQWNLSDRQELPSSRRHFFLAAPGHGATSTATAF